MRLFKNKMEKFDFNLLGISKSSYNKKEDESLKNEKNVCEIIRYANEKPTLWNLDHIYKTGDDDLNRAIERGYLSKILSDEFPTHFEKFTKEELILQSQSSIDNSISKEDVIELLMGEGEYTWIITQKGLEYLNSHPLYVFFTQHLLKFNLYEFILFKEVNEDLTLEEIGDKYINLKLEKSQLNYLKYLDYYYTLYLKKSDYDNALFYIIQRIIYETNLWILKDSHVAFDEVYDLETFYLVFDFTNLKPDFDFDPIFKKAFDEFKISELKINYDLLYSICYRIFVDCEDIYVISGELMDAYQANKQGFF